MKGRKREKAFRVQQFSIYTRVRDPQAGERGLCIPLHTPTLAPPLPSDPGDAAVYDSTHSTENVLYHTVPCNLAVAVM